MPNTSYLSLKNRFGAFGCFSIFQVLMWNSGFNADNYTRWCRQGLLLRLRRGWYAFPEFLKVADFARYIAGRIYKPSYISLHTALSYYGMIPESVSDLTSVTTLKTAGFSNKFGSYSYNSIKPELFFGFELKSIQDGRAIQFATPEKALMDLLYLYPEYDTEESMLQLRLDDSFMADELNKDRFYGYLDRFGSKALDKRVKLLSNAYGL